MSKKANVVIEVEESVSDDTPDDMAERFAEKIWTERLKTVGRSEDNFSVSVSSVEDA